MTIVLRPIHATVEEWRVVYLNFDKREQTDENLATCETIKVSIKEYGETVIRFPEHIADEIETVLEQNWI